MKKIAYIISDVEKSMAFEWLIDNFNLQKYSLTFILLNNKESSLEKYISDRKIKIYRIPYSGKKSIFKVTLQIRKILINEKIEIVHAHLFEASLFGLLAAKLAGVKKRIHTRHNSTIHHQYHPHAVKYDKFINLISTHIIAVSSIVKNVLVQLEKVKENKIYIVHHGFNIKDFSDVDTLRIDQLKLKYNLKNDKKINIGVVSRYIHWKGIQYIIPAYKNLLEDVRNVHLILANAKGPYCNEIKQLLSELPKNSYTEIEFENDSPALFKLFDIFVHVPIDLESEAFGQVYIESMAAKIPSVITLSGISNEFIIDNTHALVVPYKNSTSIHEKLLSLISNDNKREYLSSNAFFEIERRFSMEKMIKELEVIYDN